MIAFDSVISAEGCSRYDYEGVDSAKADDVVTGLREIIKDPSKVHSPSSTSLISVLCTELPNQTK